MHFSFGAGHAEIINPASLGGDNGADQQKKHNQLKVFDQKGGHLGPLM
jgi:hypothetical protein